VPTWALGYPTQKGETSAHMGPGLPTTRVKAHPSHSPGATRLVRLPSSRWTLVGRLSRWAQAIFQPTLEVAGRVDVM